MVGLLRGAEGTLAARAGNSVDRAALLVAVAHVILSGAALAQAVRDEHLDPRWLRRWRRA